MGRRSEVTAVLQRSVPSIQLQPGRRVTDLRGPRSELVQGASGRSNGRYSYGKTVRGRTGRRCVLGEGGYVLIAYTKGLELLPDAVETI
jgi:hypothetical protein